MARRLLMPSSMRNHRIVLCLLLGLLGASARGAHATEASDKDGDGVADAIDQAPTDASVCRDVDGDGCDDCALTGADGSGGDVANDGPDADRDGLCDAGDGDLDNDGVPNGDDGDRLDPHVCRDLDEDDCDDCAITGADQSGGDVGNDGIDHDRDGVCDGADADLDGDGVANAIDDAPDDAQLCRDVDGDGCDDCAITGADHSGGDVDNDGVDSDGDGLCDDGDGDADDDGVANKVDLAPYDAYLCRDVDGDGCDDCALEGPDESTGAPDHDGLDTDSDGLCDLGDLDLDGDGVPNKVDSSPFDPQVCGDVDDDGCDDCGGCAGTMPEPGVSDVGMAGRMQPGDEPQDVGGCSAGGGAGLGVSLALLALVGRRRVDRTK